MPASNALITAVLGGQLLKSETLVKYVSYTTYAGDPTSNLTPDHIGQVCFDTTNSVFYTATTAANTGWKLGGLDLGAAGTVAASKAVVVDSNKDISAFRNVTAVNYDAGASGTAGTVDVFPTTAASGKVSFTAADSAGDYTTTIVNASQAAARTYTIPDAGASASFVMTAGAQTLGGVKTFSSGIAFGAGATFDADSSTVTLSSNAGTISKMAGVITTESLSTAAAGSQALTITNTLCASTDMVFVTRTGGTSAGGTPIIKAVPGSGSFVITLDNKHASAAFDGTFILSFLLVKA